MLSFNRKRIDWIDRKLETMQKLFIKVCFKQLPDKVNAQLLKRNEEISDSIAHSAHDRRTIHNWIAKTNTKRKPKQKKRRRRRNEPVNAKTGAQEQRTWIESMELTVTPPDLRRMFHMHESPFMCSICITKPNTHTHAHSKKKKKSTKHVVEWSTNRICDTLTKHTMWNYWRNKMRIANVHKNKEETERREKNNYESEQ